LDKSRVVKSLSPEIFDGAIIRELESRKSLLRFSYEKCYKDRLGKEDRLAV
jgi:hypothetical protein